MWLDHVRSSKSRCMWLPLVTDSCQIKCSPVVPWFSDRKLFIHQVPPCAGLLALIFDRKCLVCGEFQKKHSNPKILWIDSIIFHLYSWWKRKRSWRKSPSALSSSGISGKTSDIASVEVRTPEGQSLGKTTIPYTKSCFSCTSVSLVGCFGWRIGHG